jgi:hypothetical protein
VKSSVHQAGTNFQSVKDPVTYFYLAEQATIYINVKEQVCSLAPVFSLDQLKNVLVS